MTQSEIWVVIKKLRVQMIAWQFMFKSRDKQREEQKV